MGDKILGIRHYFKGNLMERENTSIIPAERIVQNILLIRGQKVILDSDLASLYNVETKVLNQAVKRNKERFPADFMFRLTEKEKDEVVTNCDHLEEAQVFTESALCVYGTRCYYGGERS